MRVLEKDKERERERERMTQNNDSGRFNKYNVSSGSPRWDRMFTTVKQWTKAVGQKTKLEKSHNKELMKRIDSETAEDKRRTRTPFDRRLVWREMES